MDMDFSPYAFATLWKEATKAVGYIVQGVSSTISNVWNIAGQVTIYEETQRTDRQQNILQAAGNNTGVMLVFGLVILMFLAIVAAKKLRK